MAATQKKGNRSKKGTVSSNKQKKRRDEEIQDDGSIRLEVILCVVLAFCILLLLSCFHLGGTVGEAVSGFMFGLFGVMAYLLPVVLFFGFSFYVANRDNPMVLRKTIGLMLLFIFLCAFMQLVFTGYQKGMSIGDFYTSAADEHTGGGLIGGLLIMIFGLAFGNTGAYVLTIIALIIAAIILTQRPLLTDLNKKSHHALKNAEERRKEARNEKRKIRSLMLEEERNAASSSKAADLNVLKPVNVVVKPESSEPKAEIPVPKCPDTETLSPETLSPSLMEAAKKAESLSADVNAVSNPDEEEIPGYSEDLSDSLNDTTNLNGSKAKKSQKTLSNEDMTEIDTSIRNEIGEGMSKPAPVFKLPSTDMLTRGKAGKGESAKHLTETAQKLQQTFHDFGVNVRVTDVSRGPTVTRYELQPEHGVKVSRILALSDDIKLNLATSDIRIEAPIPGKAAVGIEVPNKENDSVMLRDLLESSEYQNFHAPLAFAVGKDIGGKPVIADIAKMPHLMIAGATGSGKSVCINSLIMSILFKSKPDEVRMLMIDPKVVELKMYNGIPHLLIPVVTDPKKASGALNWAVSEMTDRYNKFAEYNGVRDLKAYNERINKINSDPDITEKIPAMPRILIIVDELADLMMVSPGEVEDAICRLAQLGRAAGLHLIIATQRPSVNVVTGLIKANMPSRIALSVSSGVDSRTILDMNGAEKLLGKGDMLFYPQGYSKPSRVQGAYVSDEDISAVVKFLTAQNTDVVYNKNVEEKITESINSSPTLTDDSGNDRDTYFWEAGKLIIDKDKASIGMLQRVFRIGFNRAARIMDQLCDAGVVGDEDGTKARNILMTEEQFDNLKEQES